MQDLIEYLENQKSKCNPIESAKFDKWLQFVRDVSVKVQNLEEVEAERDSALNHLQALGIPIGEYPNQAKSWFWSEIKKVEQRLHTEGVTFKEENRDHIYTTFFNEDEHEIYAVDENNDIYPISDFDVTRVTILPKSSSVKNVKSF